MAYIFNPFTGSFDNSPTIPTISSVPDMGVRSLSANWQSTYTTVSANSANWGNSQGNALNSLSANWESTYTTVSGNSARWESSYTNVNSNSANWGSVYSTIRSTSATFVTTVATTTPGTSAVTAIIAVSALPISPNPNTLYIVL